MGVSEVAVLHSDQVKKAEAFRRMHHGPEALVLVNAWDVASARIVEECGFPAIATTSAGISFAHGFPDGQSIDRELMMKAVADIADAVNVPVTADAEAGYGANPESAAQTAREVLTAGAVGMNFEDATGDLKRPLAELSLQVERIHAIRGIAKRTGIPLVLNARTDVYLSQVGDPATRYDDTVRRLTAYRDAGADCVFAPGIRDAQVIERLVKDVGCPLNVLAVPQSPSIAELTALGVKRVSLGSGPMRAALGYLRKLGEEVKARGTFTAMEDAPPHAEMNKLMSASRTRPASK